MSVALKVCGLTRRADLEYCIEAGVDAVGLNFWSGSKRGLELGAAVELVAGLERASTRFVGVFVEASPARVKQIVGAVGLDAVQLHGDQSWADYAEVGAPLVRVIRGTPAFSELEAPTPEPAWTILDAAVEGFGGRGAQTDWDWAREAVAHMKSHPVWLAGGIRPDNVRHAIERVHPAGIDVASGAELAGASRGEKDRARIDALLEACRAG